MAITRPWIAAVLIPFGLFTLGRPARAEVPAIYYAWRSLPLGQLQCLDQARQALVSQQLVAAQTDDASVGGQANDATAVFVCLETGGATTVMLIVASPSQDRAMALREALKQAF